MLKTSTLFDPPLYIKNRHEIKKEKFRFDCLKISLLNHSLFLIKVTKIAGKVLND